MKKVILAILAVLVLGIGVSVYSIKSVSQTEGKSKGLTITEVNEQAEDDSNKKEQDKSSKDEKKVAIKSKEEIENKKKEVKEETKTKETKAESIKKENKEQKAVTKAKEQVEETKVKKEVKVEKAKSVKPKLTNEQVADKVLKGEYGNGDARKAAIEREGYNYAEIQKIVQSKTPKPKPVKRESKQASKQTSKQANKQASKQTNTNATANSKSQSSAPAVSARTDGFNFKGHHFSLANFSGTGNVPQETNNVYRWTDRPTHYLIERISPAGRVIKQVGVGDTVVVDGQSYKVTHRESGIHNDSNAYSQLLKHPAAITFQTCDTTIGPNGESNLTIWWAVKK